MKCGTARLSFSLAKNPSIPRTVGISFVWAAHLLKSIFRRWTIEKACIQVICWLFSLFYSFVVFPKPILPAGAWDQVNFLLLPFPVLPIS